MSIEHEVEVFFNREHRKVPRWVSDEESFRKALQVPEGVNVAYEQTPKETIDPWNGHTFVEGDHYVSAGIYLVNNDPPAESEEPPDHEPWAQDPDFWKSGGD